jgi:hypothetical protein
MTFRNRLVNPVLIVGAIGGEGGQTEGQINRPKTLKRAMYGSAGIELLRARMLPIRPTEQHAD